LAAVDTLIAVTQERDPAKKVALLLEGLRVSKGQDAVPLLVSLQRRAVLTAQTPGVLAALLRPMRDPSPVMKEAAARALGTVLEADYLGQQSLRDDATDALVAGLKDAGVDLAARTALLDALGATGKNEKRWEKVQPWLQVNGAVSTFAERAAQLRALGKLASAAQRQQIAAAMDVSLRDRTPCRSQSA
jgi:hypothetical protein